MAKGKISVETENIFPIIKQFLYSDQEIFLRELISNAVDATSKLKTLSSKGIFKGDMGDLKIEIILDEEAKTITIKDKGIGMNEEEVKKYLNQVAFSSAEEFIEKYKGDNSIIGHFGLGFYSAFMVADKVEVTTKSYQGGDAAMWICEGDPEYTIKKGKKDDRGTNIVLHVSDDSKEFLAKARIQGLLDKYCKFLPVEIKFGTKTKTTFEGEGDDKKEIKTEVDNIVNNPIPAWKKSPRSLKDQDYKDFYNELYPFSAEPLFWIHLNIDFPFNLTGILYFPKLSNTFEVQKNKIQLYSNQVYVTDDVKEIVPEFLTMLHGVIDSPDIPLNVSRSYLQSDSNVRKITGYITKKVAEKLGNMFKKKRDEFTSLWDDIGVFVKYGMISEDKFDKKAIKYCLLKNNEGKYFTLDEYKEKIEKTQKDKHGKTICLYTNAPEEHDSYIQAAENKGYDVVHFNTMIDNHWMQHVETKGGKDLTFVRVDSDTPANIIQKDEVVESVMSDKEQEKIKEVFTAQISGQAIDLKPLSPDDQPVFITKPEFMRRMKEMQSMQGMDMGMMPDSYNVVVNSNHPLIAGKLLKMKAGDKKDNFVKHLYDLARLNQGMLKGKEMTEFINRSITHLE